MNKSYHVTRYQIMRDQMRCVKCGAKDEDTIAGRSHCSFCAAKRRLYQQKHNARKMKLYYERKEQGACVICGAERDNATLMCSKCKESHDYAMKKYLQKG